MSIKLKQAHLRSGEVVEIADGLTVIVGPNNVGKTLLLNELYQELLRHPGQDQGMHMRVIDHINLDKLGSVEEFIEWLANNYYRREPGAYPDGRYTDSNYAGPSATAGPTDPARTRTLELAGPLPPAPTGPAQAPRN